MSRFLLIFSTCLFVWSMASTDARAEQWLIFVPGKDRSTSIWTGPTPVPGIDCPAGSKVVLWNPDASDQKPENYKFDSGKGELKHEPPPAPVVPPETVAKKEIDETLETVAADGTVSDANFIKLLRMHYMKDAAARKTKWDAEKPNFESK